MEQNDNHMDMMSDNVGNVVKEEKNEAEKNDSGGRSNNRNQRGQGQGRNQRPVRNQSSASGPRQGQGQAQGQNQGKVQAPPAGPAQAKGPAKGKNDDNEEYYTITIGQSVAILIDGNNMEKSIHGILGDSHAMLNFDTLIPKLLDNRALNRLIYFREGKSISAKLAERLHDHYHGSVCPCHKSADIPLSIKATQLAKKVDTIIILSGDSDYVELVRHLRSEGVRVEIAAIEKTTAQILRDEADYFHPITEVDWFVYSGGKRRSGGGGGRR